MRGVFEILLSNEVVSEASITQLYHKQVQGDVLTHVKLASQQVIGRGEYINKDNWKRKSHIA